MGIKNAASYIVVRILGLFFDDVLIGHKFPAFRKFKTSTLNVYDVDEFEEARYWSDDNEGLLLIKIDNNADYVEGMKKYYDKENKLIKERKNKQVQDYHENEFKEANEYWIRKIATCSKILNEPKLKTKAITELERRKAVNIELLRSLGLII